MKKRKSFLIFGMSIVVCCLSIFIGYPLHFLSQGKATKACKEQVKAEQQREKPKKDYDEHKSDDD